MRHQDPRADQRPAARRGPPVDGLGTVRVLPREKEGARTWPPMEPSACEESSDHPEVVANASHNRSASSLIRHMDGSQNCLSLSRRDNWVNGWCTSIYLR